MEKYSRSSSLPHHLEIHWFSIINSCVTVLLLTGFLAATLIILKNDFVKYAHDEEMAEDQEETGWKYIHSDVFRYPKHKSLFSADLVHYLYSYLHWLVCSILTIAGLCVGCYICTYVWDCRLYFGLFLLPARRNKLGENFVVNWKSVLRSSVCHILLSQYCCNSYNATAALPFGTIVVIVLIWTLITSPLLVLGGIAGKNGKAECQAPCQTTKYPREIPLLPWYRGTLPQMAMAGFLPFSAIYVELYYILASVWGHRIYTIYSILFIVFIILLIVTAFITAALTYF